MNILYQFHEKLNAVHIVLTRSFTYEYQILFFCEFLSCLDRHLSKKWTLIFTYHLTLKRIVWNFFLWMQAWLSLGFQLFYISLASFETCQSWIVDSTRSSRIICIACFNLCLLRLMVFDAWYSDPGWYLGSLSYNTGVRWRYAIAFLTRIKWVVIYFCSWNVWESVSVLLFILYRIELVYVAVWFVSVNNLLVLSVCDIVLWFLWRCVIA